MVRAATYEYVRDSPSLQPVHVSLREVDVPAPHALEQQTDMPRLDRNSASLVVALGKGPAALMDEKVDECRDRVGVRFVDSPIHHFSPVAVEPRRGECDDLGSVFRCSTKT